MTMIRTETLTGDLVERPRRLRTSPVLRGLVRETRLHPDQFVAPLFVEAGFDVKREISSMPGQYRWSPDRIAEAIDPLLAVGVRSVILFGIPEEKDPIGSDSFHEHGIVQQGLRALRERFPELFLITDVCLCEYTDHGHCGVLDGDRVLNDETLPLLQRQVLSHVDAGADMVAPSGMMDGTIGALREALDAEGHTEVGIMSYAVKYASAYYGPFRAAAESAPQRGDRRGYQMDPANAREALREARLDAEQGADILMVKPALAYLDVIRSVRESFDLPVAAYNVSGEYSMIKTAAAAGLIDGRAVMMETLTSIRRAGADVILTYFAREAAEVLRHG